MVFWAFRCLPPCPPCAPCACGRTRSDTLQSSLQRRRISANHSHPPVARCVTGPGFSCCRIRRHSGPGVPIYIDQSCICIAPNAIWQPKYSSSLYAWSFLYSGICTTGTGWCVALSNASAGCRERQARDLAAEVRPYGTARSAPASWMLQLSCSNSSNDKSVCRFPE